MENLLENAQNGWKIGLEQKNNAYHIMYAWAGDGSIVVQNTTRR